jgi:hypothetical protein
LRPPTAKRPKPCAPGNANVGPVEAVLDELEREELDKLDERELELMELERDELDKLDERELELIEFELERELIELDRELELIKLDLLDDEKDEERDEGCDDRDDETLVALQTAPLTTGFSAAPPFLST